jgi:DNA-binding NarL/FixJ family response regulator
MRLAARLLHPRGGLWPELRAVARLEGRPEEEVAADLLALALYQRQAAEDNLARWRELSPRQQEVAALVCFGLTNAEIAGRLVISNETVKSHVHHILEKFNLRRRGDLRQELWGWDFSDFAHGLEPSGPAGTEEWPG